MTFPRTEGLKTAAPVQMLARMREKMPKARVYLVGGAIRDALLDRAVKDFDFVIAHVTREKLETWLRQHGQVDLTGKRFGVFKFLPTAFPVDEPIDIALPRRERSCSNSKGGYRDFDLQSDPDIPIEEDLSRRDFTINAIAYDLHEGNLIDPFDGAGDIEKKIIRAVGNPTERFREDLSRVLRAIRFAVQLAFKIESNTWEALSLAVAHLNDTYPDGQRVVPRETIGCELAKAFSVHPKRTVTLLAESGALAVLFPELTRIPLLPESTCSTTVALALLFQHLPADTARRLVRETGLSSLPAGSPLRVRADDVGWIIAHLDCVAADQSAADFENLFMNKRGEIFLEVLEALDKIELTNAIRTRKEQIEKRCAVRPGGHIPPLVSGNDVVKRGIPPGPRVCEILRRVRSAQLEGELTSRVDAERWLDYNIETKNRARSSVG